MGLRYIGKGFIDGVPARDLSDDEVARYGLKRLLATGLYEKIVEKRVFKIEEKENGKRD